MSYYRTEYQRFLDNPKVAKLAGDVSLIYVPTTTKFEQPDNVITHVLKQNHVVKTKSHKVISAIEGSDALCLDMETTLEFMEGGGAYLPSLDDNFLADRVVTFPTIHIVHFDTEHQIKQIRIHWDQACLLRQVEVIGARGRAWPIRDGKDQIRLLKTAVTERSTAAVPAQETQLPVRSSSPSKRRIKDPYAAESLDDLLAPDKEAAEREARAEPSKPSFAGKRYTRDPYGAGSLNEILSPSKQPPAPIAPFAPASGRPAARNFSDIFVKDDDVPESPSRPQRRAPRVPEEDESGQGPVDEDRNFYKTIPGKFSHFDIGGDNPDREIKEETRSQHSNIYRSKKWDFGDYETPVKNTRAPRGEEVRHVDLSDDESPEKLNVIKPRRDADHHPDLADENEDGRIISSFGGRGQRLYQNRLFDDEEGPEPSEREKKNEPLAVTGNAVNRKKNFDSQFDIVDDSSVPSKENPVPTAKHDKAVKQMQSHWHDYDESPQGKRAVPATALRNPLTHNQPSWQLGDE